MRRRGYYYSSNRRKRTIYGWPDVNYLVLAMVLPLGCPIIAVLFLMSARIYYESLHVGEAITVCLHPSTGQKARTIYDKNERNIQVHIGNKVLIKYYERKGKLSSKWKGTFEVIGVHDNENVSIQRSGKKIIIHKKWI